jgi:hypothetical protein
VRSHNPAGTARKVIYILIFQCASVVRERGREEGGERGSIVIHDHQAARTFCYLGPFILEVTWTFQGGGGGESHLGVALIPNHGTHDETVRLSRWFSTKGWYVETRQPRGGLRTDTRVSPMSSRCA